MKKLIYTVFACALFASCEKPGFDKDACIDKVDAVREVGADTLARIKTLLTSNKIDAAGLKFYGANFTDSITLDGHTSVYQHVYALQYFNNLPVLNGDIGYHFKDGVFQTTISPRFTGVPLNNTPASAPAQVAKQFVAECAKDSYASKYNYADSCLNTTFGYLNTNNTSVATQPVFIKVWRVTPKHQAFPVGYFRDDNAETVSFFNGLLTGTR